MFNWFKSKVELKKCSDIMSSSHIKKGLKIGSEIIVPNNFECLIFHKGKCFNSLTDGKYTMDNKTFAELINVQQKLKFKTKYIKLVCHYINLGNQKLVVKFKKQQFEIDFNINNSSKFASLILLHTFKVDNDYVLCMLKNVFHELVAYVKGDYKKITNSSLKDYGIVINNFSPLNNKTSILGSTKKTIQSTFDKTQCDHEQQKTEVEVLKQADTLSANNNIVQQNPNNNQITMQSNDTGSTAEKPQSSYHICPKCNNTTKFNTTYCLRCGHKMQ